MYPDLDLHNCSAIKRFKSYKSPMDVFHKCLFLMFGISLVFPSSLTSSKCRLATFCNYAATFINVIILMFTALLAFGMVYMLPLKSATVACVSEISALALFRCMLAPKLEALREISVFLAKATRRASIKYTTNCWIYLWTVLSCLTHVFVFVFGIIASAQMVQSYKVIPIINVVISAIYSVYCVLILMLPVNTFALYYVCVCRQLRRLLTDFSTKMSSSGHPDYDKLLSSYQSIQSTIEWIDDQLSLLMLIEIVFSFCMMYFTIEVMLHPDMVPVPSRVAVVCCFLNAFLGFILMTASASLMVESSLQIGVRARSLPPQSAASPLAQQRFHSCSEKQLSLTVWKIVPISRQFICGTIGALFTYIILIDGLLTVRPIQEKCSR